MIKVALLVEFVQLKEAFTGNGLPKLFTVVGVVNVNPFICAIPFVQIIRNIIKKKSLTYLYIFFISIFLIDDYYFC